MLYVHRCSSPLGELFLTSDGEALTGLWFGDRKAPVPLPEPPRDCPELPVFAAARRWLELYFSGREPDFTPALRLEGTPFQREVWALLRKVPYGQTVTYGDLAGRLAARRSPARMSAQAVGGAVGRNPIALIVPCHRVIGADGGLTGYAGGQERKRFLLALERGDR